MKSYSLVISICLLFASCDSTQEKSSQNESSSHLGLLKHEFPISEAVKGDFDQGLLLLHSFEYEDARSFFEKAVARDSNEVFAYWGIAMTHYKALWGLQDLDAGREVMVLIGKNKTDRLAKAEEGIERDLWMGIEILYGEGELTERNEAFAKHLEDLHAVYPSNQEVSAFYALSLIWAAPIDADDEVYKRSAAIAQSILTENPEHPGALHYTIHAFDNPELAPFAIEAANRYAKVAPDAAHALHMPSHIYLDRGMWNEMVSSNENSYAASVKRMEQKGLSDAARGFHSYHWLHYGYLQQGKYEQATQLMTDMLKYTSSAGTGSARGYLVAMQNFQVLETESWGLTEDPMEVDVEDLGLSTIAQAHFFKGLMAYRAGNPTAIKEEIGAFEPKIAAAELLVTTDGIAMCSAGPTRYAPNKHTILIANTMLNQMQAYKYLAEGNLQIGEKYMQKAVELETELRFPFGPPDVPYPSFEQYGYWLLAQGRSEEAIAQFDESLRRAPNRAKALQGKMQLLNSLGRTDEAKEIKMTLDQFWQRTQVATL